MGCKNIKREIFLYEQQSCLNTESLIGCLTVDYFLIRRGKFPFASVLYYILLNSINNQIYIQNLLSKKKKPQKKSKVVITSFVQDYTNEDKVIAANAFQDYINKNNLSHRIIYHLNKADIPIDECEKHSIHSEDKKLNKEEKLIMTNAIQDNTNKDNFQYSKTYYFDKSGMPIDECEGQRLRSEGKKLIETCCRIEIPRGFQLTNYSPEICFNLSGLSCFKNPIVQKVDLPTCKGEYPKKCEVVAGYKIRAVGEVNFFASLPICPINGFCSAKQGHVCCSNTVSVNEVISHTCCPKPCSSIEPCLDWTYAYFCTTLVKDDCGSYIQVKMGIALEYLGTCECDEE